MLDIPDSFNYKILESIFIGQHTSVWKGIHVITGEFVAIKVIPHTFYNASFEISLMKKLDHPLLVHIYDTFVYGESTFIVMEYLVRGDIGSYVNQVGALPEVSAKSIFVQIITAFDYLHEEMSIIHGDLKAENILLDSYYNIRIIDFGMSYILNKERKSIKFSFGSLPYLAPEAIINKIISKSTDIWSIGVLLFAMLAGYLPFEDPDPQVIIQKVLTNHIEYPSHFSSSVKDLLNRIFQVDPTLRITIPQIKEHPWFFAEYSNSLVQFSKRYGIMSSIEYEIPTNMISYLSSFNIDIPNLRSSLFMNDLNNITTIFRILRRTIIKEQMSNPSSMNSDVISSLNLQKIVCSSITNKSRRPKSTTPILMYVE